MSLIIPYTDCAFGTLNIGGTSMHDPRWHMPDLKDFIESEVRGDDTDLPHVAGTVPNPRRFARSRYVPPLYVSGYVDENGECQTDVDPTIQLWTNLQALKSLVITRNGVNTTMGPGEGGTREITFITPDGETWTSWVHVPNLATDFIQDGVWVGAIELLLMYDWTVVES